LQLAFSAYFISMVPILIVYLFMQRQFVSGITQGALKG
jgi:ABC-type glycerol-3-phosphate transport system permease component